MQKACYLQQEFKMAVTFPHFFNWSKATPDIPFLADYVEQLHIGKLKKCYIHQFLFLLCIQISLIIDILNFAIVLPHIKFLESCDLFTYKILLTCMIHHFHRSLYHGIRVQYHNHFHWNQESMSNCMTCKIENMVICRLLYQLKILLVGVFSVIQK